MSAGATTPLLSPRGGLILFAAVASLIALGYSLYTQQIWEDSLITLRHSENLLRGEGLVYNLGERVHGFTSPVQALLLALCSLLTGQTSYVATIWLYRVFSIAAFAGSGVLLLKTLNEAAPRWSPALWFLGIVYAFDAKSVAFCTNGMETAFVLLFLAGAVNLMSQTCPEQWPARGLCWGGLMWARPDGCVLIVALALAELLFLAAGRRRTIAVSLAKSAGLSAVVYAPWLLFAWSYFGTPIPHTVIAKANEAGLLAQLFTMLDDLVLSVVSMAAETFRPIQYGENIWLPIVGWSRAINGLTKAAGLFGLFYWMFPGQDRLGRAASFAFTLCCLYFSSMPETYPWYYPPATLLGILLISRGFTVFADAAADHRFAWIDLRWRQWLAGGVAAVLAIGQIAVFAAAAQEEMIRQSVIEMGNRALIGCWLKENGRSDESVYLEPLGYIGYFSGMRMIDYPGLVSPEVVRLRREICAKNPSGILLQALLIKEINPDWVVLRYVEYEALRRSPAWAEFERDYRLVRVFTVVDRLDECAFLPGDYSLRFDAAFGVFRRNAADH